MTSKASDIRLGQAVLLLAGALFLVVMVAPDDGRFYWTPLTLGLAYLGAAIVGGRDGGHWATACALTGWGLAVVFAGAVRPDLDISGLYLAGAGLGMTGGLLLQRVGFDVDALGLAVTVMAAGLVLALTTQAVGVLDDARTFAAALAVVAVANIALAVRDTQTARRPRRKTALLLALWVLGAVALGVPSDRPSQASAQVRSAPAPKIVHSGPECLAGHGAAPPAA